MGLSSWILGTLVGIVVNGNEENEEARASMAACFLEYRSRFRLLCSKIKTINVRVWGERERERCT